MDNSLQPTKHIIKNGKKVIPELLELKPRSKGSIRPAFKISLSWDLPDVPLTLYFN
jgi:hypothetical protein